jgi:hypothetical protein
MNLSAYRIGYVITLSFMLIASMFTLTLGYYPPPSGPVRPEYPTYSNSSLQQNTLQNNFGTQNTYQDEYTKYQDDLKKYEEEQKGFVKDKIIPYTRNVLVGWVLAIVLFEIIGLVLTKMGQSFVGGAYAFSGVWAVVFGPVGSLIWFASAIISSFAGRANQEYTADPVFQAVSLALILGSVVLTVLGVVLFGNLKISSQPSPS